MAFGLKLPGSDLVKLPSSQNQGLSKNISMDYLRLFASTKTWVFQWGFSTPSVANDPVERTVTGSGNASASNDWGVSVQTGATANSRARCAMKNLTGGVAIGPDGAFGRTIDFTEPGILAFRFTLIDSTTNGKCWLKFGDSCNADGDITAKGIQVRLDNRTLVYGVHNGTTLESDTGATLPAGVNASSMRVEWDGNGNWQFYLDDALDGEVSHTAFTSGYGFFCSVETNNGADTANQWADFSPVKFGTLA